MSAEPVPPPTVEAVAREAIGWLDVGPEAARVETPSFVLLDRPLPLTWFACALRLRLEPAAVPAAIATVRDWFRARRRSEFFWFVTDESSPVYLFERLVAAGAEPDDELTAMVLGREPDPAPNGVDVRRVTTFAEYRAWDEIAKAGFGWAGDESPDAIHQLRDAWRHWQTEPARRFYLAWIDGRPVAEAGLAMTTAGPAILSGGATVPEARGRGAYRALVRARWEDARRLGASSIVVQASAMSRPVLERSGFRPVGSVRMLRDPLA